MPFKQPLKTALLIGSVWPEPLSSAAGWRTTGLIELFEDLGWKVIFTSSARENSAMEALSSRGIPIFSSQLNDSSWDDRLRAIQPELVLMDRFVTEEQFGWRVQSLCPNALRILDSQDLHFLRRARQRGEALSPHLQSDALRELASIYRSDCTLILSSFEMGLLTQDYGVPAELLMHLPFFYSPHRPAARSYGERAHFCMIGNFRHPPNYDGVFWFKKELWPGIRKQLPQAEVHLYGAYPPREIMDLDEPKSGFRVLGPIPGPREKLWPVLSQYRVNLAPLRFGAGIKGKVSDGWLCGTPAASTSIGAEGMTDGSDWGGLITGRDDAEAFIQNSVRLYQEASLWHQAQSQGYRLLKTLFDRDHHALRFQETLRHLEENRGLNRGKNKVGQILWHQSLRSTEYFSRWIEQKNSFPKDLTEPREPGIQRTPCKNSRDASPPA